MEIPYTVRPRPDTGLANPKLGIWLFLASEVMLFGGLFAGYIFMRLSAEPWYWPVGWLNVPVGTFNTFILIFSSVTIILAWECLKMKKFKAYQTWLAVTWICGLAFLGVKLGIEWPDKFHHFGAYVKKEALPKYEAFLGNEDSKAADGSVLEGRRSRLTHDGKPMAERRFISGHVHDTEGAKQTALYLSGIPYVSPVQLSNIIGSVKSKKELLDELPKKISAAEAKSAADFGGGPDGERKRIAAIEALRLEKRIAENSLASISKLMETKYGMTPEEQAIILDPKKSDDERKKASDAYLEKVNIIHLTEVDAANAAPYNHAHEVAEFIPPSRVAVSDPKLNALPGVHEHKEIVDGKEVKSHALILDKADLEPNHGAFLPRLNTYLASYFMITGLHGLHVLGGCLVFIYFWLPIKGGSKLFKTNHGQLCNRIEVAGLFWHLVDLVWIFVFPIFYLL